MRRRRGDRRQIRHTHAFEVLGSQSGGAYRYVEHLGNGRSDGALILLTVAEHHVVGSYACLTVCRSGQIVEPRSACHGMLKLYCVAHGIDVSRRGLQIFVHLYAASAQLYACLLGQRGGRTHADGQQHEVGHERLARVEEHFDAAFFLRELLDTLAKQQSYALVHEMTVHV